MYQMKDEKKTEARVEKVGVAWLRKFKNGKDGFKLSLNGEIYVAYKNLKKKDEKDPDFVVVKFIDELKK